MKTLFTFLVRSNLEFGLLIWSHNSSTYNIELDNVQNKFLKSLSNKLNFPFSRDSTNQTQETLSVDRFSLRRDLADIMLIFDILNGHILCLELLAMIGFRVPRLYTRNL